MRSWIAVLVVGCGSSPSPHTTDIAPTLRFADRSDAEINALICSAASNDVLGATTIVTTFEAPGDTCPGVQGNAPAGGCTSSSGTAITGSVTSNSNDNSIQFDGLTLSNPTFVETWDGAVDGTWLGGSSDLTVGRAGTTVRADLGYSCATLDQGDECEICQSLCTPEGSGVELVGVGGALVRGTWYSTFLRDEAQAPVPEIQLVGEDTLTMTTVTRTTTWAIGSRSGIVSCPLVHAQI